MMMIRNAKSYHKKLQISTEEGMYYIIPREKDNSTMEIGSYELQANVNIFCQAWSSEDKIHAIVDAVRLLRSIYHKEGLDRDQKQLAIVICGAYGTDDVVKAIQANLREILDDIMDICGVDFSEADLDVINTCVMPYKTKFSRTVTVAQKKARKPRKTIAQRIAEASAFNKIMAEVEARQEAEKPENLAEINKIQIENEIKEARAEAKKYNKSLVSEPAVEPVAESQELEGPESEIKTLISNDIPAADDSSNDADGNKNEEKSITDLSLIESNTGFATDLRLAEIKSNIKVLVQAFDLDDKLINDLYWLAKDSYIQYQELDLDIETYDYDNCSYKLSCQRFFCNLSDAIDRELTEEEVILINRSMCNFEE